MLERNHSSAPTVTTNVQPYIIWRHIKESTLVINHPAAPSMTSDADHQVVWRCIKEYNTGDKPSSCSQWDYKWKRLGHLRNHKKTHIGDNHSAAPSTVRLFGNQECPKISMTSNPRQNCRIGQPCTKKWFFSPDQFGLRRKRKGKSGEIRSLLETLGSTL